MFNASLIKIYTGIEQMSGRTDETTVLLEDKKTQSDPTQSDPTQTDPTDTALARTKNEKLAHRVRYWKAAFNGNLEDMEKYKYPIRVVRFAETSEQCPYCMTSSCVHNMFLSDDILYNTFHTLQECVLLSKCDVKTIIQCSIKIKHHVVSYKPRQYQYDSNGFYLSMERFYPLPLDAMEEAFKAMWLPNNEFWRSMSSPKIHNPKIVPPLNMTYLIKTKLLLEKYKRLLSVNNKMDKIKNRIKKLNRIIQPYISMKINLYIMVRANKLCHDTANYVETFIRDF